MKNIYSTKYINSMFDGFKKTIFHKNGKIADEELFFRQIKESLKSLKQKKNVIYYLSHMEESIHIIETL